MFFNHFFYPEIKPFINESYIEVLNSENKFYNFTYDSDFDEKRLIGENDNYICSLIREDSVEDFISFVNRTNLSVDSVIPYSMFETNEFLIINHPINLIEYAAFFGSIHIFNYLRFNKATENPILWLCSIHGRNADIIHQIEDDHIEFPDKTYISFFIESIICHHNEIANYFKNYLTQEILNSFESNTNERIISAITSSSNYFFIPDNLNDFFIYYCLSSKRYYELVNLYLNMMLTKKNEEKTQQIFCLSFQNYNKIMTLYSYLFKNKQIDKYCNYLIKNLSLIVIPPVITCIKENDFNQCSKLYEIVIPISVKSIGRSAFQDCKSLRKIIIPNSVTLIGPFAFAGCSQLPIIEIPNSVTSIEFYAFYKCFSLEKIFLSRSLSSIDESTFCECKKLKNILIPFSIKLIEPFAFSECKSLDNVFFENPSLLTTIGYGAFSECKSLRKIIIPKSVKSICNKAFKDCTKLVFIYTSPKLDYIGPDALEKETIRKYYDSNE